MRSQILRRGLVGALVLGLCWTPLAQSPNQEQWLGQADTLVEAGRLDEALQSYKGFHGKYPESARALYQIGWIYNEQNKFDTASRWLKKAAELSPRDAAIQLELGYALYKLKNTEASLAAYRLASQLQADFLEAWVGQGDLLFELKKDYAGAIQAYARAIELGSQEASIYYRKGWAHNELKQFKESEGLLKKAVELDPKLAPAWLEWGYSLLRNQRNEEAVQALNRASQLDPKLALAHFYLGRTYLQMGEQEQAAASLRKLRPLDAIRAQQLEQEVATFKASKGPASTR